MSHVAYPLRSIKIQVSLFNVLKQKIDDVWNNIVVCEQMPSSMNYSKRETKYRSLLKHLEISGTLSSIVLCFIRSFDESKLVWVEAILLLHVIHSYSRSRRKYFSKPKTFLASCTNMGRISQRTRVRRNCVNIKSWLHTLPTDLFTIRSEGISHSVVDCWRKTCRKVHRPAITWRP